MGAPTPICLRRCHYHLHNDLTVAPQGLLYDIPAFLVKGSFSYFAQVLVMHQEVEPSYAV